MNQVRIADLKSHLSEHLRAVRRGQSLTVLDRETPIARLIPYNDQPSDLVVRTPLPDAPCLQHVALPPPLPLRHDASALLIEERQRDR
jgi:prevent-host-death family protein